MRAFTQKQAALTSFLCIALLAVTPAQANAKNLFAVDMKPYESAAVTHVDKESGTKFIISVSCSPNTQLQEIELAHRMDEFIDMDNHFVAEKFNENVLVRQAEVDGQPQVMFRSNAIVIYGGDIVFRSTSGEYDKFGKALFKGKELTVRYHNPMTEKTSVYTMPLEDFSKEVKAQCASR